jgi:hypothetical protein
MRFLLTKVLAMAVALYAVGVTPSAAPAHAETVDPEAARIASAGHPLKWNWTPPGRTQRFGHAETLIHAPMDAVRRLVVDYAHYTLLAPQAITTSRVVGHGPDGSADVYFRMGVLNNTITLWNVTRFASPKPSPGGDGETVEGKMVPGKGNIDDAAFVWTFRPLSDAWTLLKFDLELSPGVPAPQSLIDEQTRDSAMDAVDSIHDRAQGSKTFEAYAP